MSTEQVQVGDKVTWNWGSGQPGGTVGEVKEGDVSVTSHRGNVITKHGKPGDPAVHVERSGNDVVKLAHELNVDSKKAAAPEHEKKDESKSTEEKPAEKKEGEGVIHTKDNGIVDKKEENGDAGEKDEVKAGDKRKADEQAGADEKEDDKKENEAEQADVKKQKATNGSANGTKKGPGRPKAIANGDKKPGAKKEKKVPAVGKSERKTRSQGQA